MYAQGIRWNRGTADSVEAIAAGDEITFQRSRLACMLELDLGPSLQVVNADGFRLEKRRHAGSESRGNQILDHFMLRVNGDRFAAGELGEVDAVTGTIEAQLHSRVNEAFPLQARADARFHQQIDGALLKHARANALLDIFLRARFEHDRMNALQVQQMRKRESGGACSDDSDLGRINNRTRLEGFVRGSMLL